MNSKSTKKKLTGSIWALVVCFILLLGTTFAWFTDTASTNVNTIQAGNLDVALEMQDAQGNWVSAEGETLNFVKAEGAENEDVLWEPGCTYNLPALRVVNKGNLALKYKVEVAAVSGDEKLAEVIDVLFLEQRQGEDGAATVSANETVPGMQSVGTLADLFNSTDEDGIAYGNLTAGATTGVINVSLHMQETAGNEYQGKAIDGIQVTVLATQDTVEFDSNDNQYDANAEFSIDAKDIDSLRTAVVVGGNVTLIDDITVSHEELVDTPSSGLNAMLVIKKDTVIDLNGHEFKYPAESECYVAFYVTDGATLTIKDSSKDKTGTVKANDPEGTYLVFVNKEATVNIYGGNFHQKSGSCIYKNDGHINIYGGTFQTDANSGSLLNLGNLYSSYGPIMVYGGSFKNFKPGVTNGGENKVADGYKVVQDGDWYNVVPK